MTRRDVAKLFVRFLVIFGLCCPVFVVIGISLGDNNNGFLETTIYVVIGGLLLCVEEYFYWKAWKKRMIAKQSTTPEKYFDNIKKIRMQKRNVKILEQKPSKQQIEINDSNVKKMSISNGRKKNGK